MATTTYRPQQTTDLRDLANQLALQSDNPIAPPAASQAPAVNTEGVYTPEERQRMIEAMLAPEDYGQEPQVDKPNAFAMLFSGLGDAVNAFAAGKSGDSSFKTDFFDQYQKKLDQQRADLQKYKEKVAADRDKSKRRTFDYLLGEDSAAKERNLEASVRQAEQLAAEKRVAEGIQQRATEEQGRRTFELNKQKQEQDYHTALQKERFTHEEGMKKLEDKAKTGDKDAQKALDQFSKGAQIANGFKNGVLADPKTGAPAIPPLWERIKNGEKPEEIRREFEDEMTQEGIFGPPRDLARNYLNERMLRAHRQAQEEASKPAPQGE